MQIIEKPTNWRFNDGGRKEAGYNGSAGDCVARAVAIATGISYKEAYESLADINTKTKGDKARSARNGIQTKSTYFKRFMTALGWKWTPTMLVGQGCKTHLKSDELPMGKIICAVSKHYVAVIDGIVNDTHDCTREGTRCVYGYWSKA
jgi:hypothetical protein